jgi:hypothetical protein
LVREVVALVEGDHGYAVVAAHHHVHTARRVADAAELCIPGEELRRPEQVVPTSATPVNH